MLDDRELATVILVAIVVVAALAAPRSRRVVVPAIRDFLRALWVKSVLLVFLLFFAWCALSVGLASAIGLWSVDQLKDTILIVLTVGLPVLFRSTRAKSAPQIWRKLVSEAVALSVFLAFYLNLEPFPLWAELLLQPVLLLVVLMELVARRQESAKPLRGCLNVAMAIVGIVVFSWTTVRLVVTAAERDWSALVFDLGLVVWLPLSMFGFFYGFALFAAMEGIVKSMRRLKKPPPTVGVLLAVLVGTRMRLKWAKEFTWVHQQRVGRDPSPRAALHGMRAFRQSVADDASRESERLARLETMAGEPGTDARGAQLDRREFDGTKRALRFIEIAQANRYQGLGNRYWDDLTDMVISPLDRYGFVGTHGITVETTPDGQKWRAWRVLPNSWVLGIGGKDGNPGEFLYSGPSAPDTWPADPDWTDATWALDLPVDWERDDSSQA